MVQKTFASSSTHAIAGTVPVSAANAMGIPNPNAMPRYACGIAKKRLKKGYDAARANAGNDSAIVSPLRA
jgi:hypothetical protein